MRNVKINEAGHILVKNLSAFWIPEIKIEREIHGTVYTITQSCADSCPRKGGNRNVKGN